jgi:hypothetical protein
MADLRPGDFGGVSDNGINFLLQLVTELAQCKAAINQLLTDYNAHSHGGITTGASSSSVVTSSSAVAVVAGEVSDASIENPPT